MQWSSGSVARKMGLAMVRWNGAGVRVEKGEVESDDEGKEAGEMRLLVIHIMYELW